MADPFVITQSSTKPLKLNRQKGGEVVFTVKSDLPRSCRAMGFVEPLKISAKKQGDKRWFTLFIPDKQPENGITRLFEPEGEQVYRYHIRVPPRTRHGTYAFQFIIADERNPDDICATCPIDLRVYIPFNWLRWILVSLIILVSVGGTIAYIVKAQGERPYIQVAEKFLFVYAGPGRNFERLDELKQDAVVYVRHKTEAFASTPPKIWYEVESDSREWLGWVNVAPQAVVNSGNVATQAQIAALVIEAAETPAFRTPAENSSVVFKTAPKSSVRAFLIEEHYVDPNSGRHWYLVKLPEGKTGWIPYDSDNEQDGLVGTVPATITGTPATSVPVFNVSNSESIMLYDYPDANPSHTPLATYAAGQNWEVKGRYQEGDVRWFYVQVGKNAYGWVQYQLGVTALDSDYAMLPEQSPLIATFVPSKEPLPTRTPMPTMMEAEIATDMPAPTATLTASAMLMPTHTLPPPATATMMRSPTPMATDTPTITPSPTATETPSATPTLSPFATNTTVSATPS